ncbi:MAG TPA: single-stranded DNA-binding protein [Parcubacteria group bacterium]|nr:single-stranded DNA-binding protein [Parcubacteria group bacterium]
MYLNKAMVIGNLTRDPEMKSLPSGIQVTSFSLATNRVWKDKNGAKQESVDYHNIVVFGRQAEIVSQFLRKGSSALIEGRMQTRSWDSPDGKKNYRTEIVADRVQFGPRSSGAPASTSSPAKQDDDKSSIPPMETIDYPEESISLDDIPF